MSAAAGFRLRLRRWAWTLGTWWAARRRPALTRDALGAHDYRTQTRGMGLRMTEWLRDLLRPRWLKLHRGPARPDGE